MGREGATHLTTSKSAIYRDFSRLIGEKCVAPEAKRPNLELLVVFDSPHETGYTF